MSGRERRAAGEVAATGSDRASRPAALPASPSSPLPSTLRPPPAVPHATRPIFLAPHYDDIALSCGGVVAALADAGMRPLIVTIFGGDPQGAELTAFARWQHERWGTAEDADTLATRREEDRAAAAILGAESRCLPHLDAIYRGDRYLSDDALFGPLAPDEAPLIERIASEILALPELTDAETATIYVPLALGNHVDHQLVYAAGRLIATRPRDYPPALLVLAYEDFPYTMQYPEALEQRLATLADQLGPVELVNIARTLNRRIAAIAAYRSQLPVIFRFTPDWRQALATHASQLGASGDPAERFWPLTARA